MVGLGFVQHLLFLDILVGPPNAPNGIYVPVQSMFEDVFTGALLHLTKMSDSLLCFIICAPASTWWLHSSSIYISNHPEQG